jgi:hypothetical protein
MATEGGPNIVTDELVLALDAANPKSYPGSGTTWKDLTRFTDGSLVNGPTYSSDKGGNLVFDGANDYCQVTSDGFGRFNSQTYTVEAWVNPDSNNADSCIFSYDYTSHVEPYYSTQLRFTTLGRIFLGWNNGSSYQSLITDFSFTYPQGEWQHVVGVYASGRQEIIHNGILIKSGTATDTITFYNQEVWVGRMNYSSGYFDGKIASVKHYTEALSLEQIQQNYNATKHRFK